jgi:hypothetical protein
MSPNEDPRKPRTLANPKLLALDEEHLEPLVEKVLDHDVGAWKELWLVLDPAIEAIGR